MLLSHLGDLASDPVSFLYRFLIVMFSIVLGITVHEFAHAYVAFKRGDDTAARLGRVTLNPLAHLDPLGTIVLMLASFGWGKPVPFNPARMKTPLRASVAAVSVAGVVANLLLAAIAALVFRLVVGGASPGLIQLLLNLVVVNIILALFNLIPLPPLDGFNLLSTVLPAGFSRQMAPVARYGPFLLFGLLLLDRVSSARLLAFIEWPIDMVASVLLGIG